MFKAKVQKYGDYTRITLVGKIDESVDLIKLMGFHPGGLKVNCRKIDSINSCGIRSWKRYFLGQREKGISLSFSECSPALVELSSMFPELILPSEIESLVVSLHCRSCNVENLTKVRPKDLVSIQLSSIETRCQHCGGTTHFDGDIRAYDVLKKQFLKNAIEATRSIKQSERPDETFMDFFAAGLLEKGNR